jgi:hypothetical protein
VREPRAVPIARTSGMRTELLAHREDAPNQALNRPDRAISGAGRRSNKPVVRGAPQNAASVASLLLTTERMVADKPEERGLGGGASGMPPGDMI